LVKISEVPQNKKDIKIIYFASEADRNVRWQYCLNQFDKLKENGFDLESYSDPLIQHYPFDLKIWDYVRDPLIKNMYKTTYKLIQNEGIVKIVIEPMQEHKNTLIFLHGYCDTA